MPRPGRPDDNLDDAVAAYKSSDRGISPIADEFNVGRRKLHARLVQRGTLRSQADANRLAMARGQDTRAAARTALPVDAVVRAYLGGDSVNGIAKRTGVSRSEIERVLRTNGVRLRGLAEANRVMMARRTPEENARNAEAAHAATRGVPQSPQRIALARQRKLSFETKCLRASTLHGVPTSNPLELLYAAWLRDRGVETVPQYAVGPYNIDLAAEPVAVEVFGGNWHGWGHHAAVVEERSRYLLDRGWFLVVVWVNQTSQGLSERSADQLVAFVEQARRDPTLRGQYRMIWGDGEVVPVGGRDLHQLARVPARGRRKRTG